MPTTTSAGASVIDLVTPTADGSTHHAWAAHIARLIARHGGFLRGSQEEAEIEAVAAFTLVRKREQFKPLAVYGPNETADGHFRGWVHPSVRAECMREVKRLRGGGTFHTPRACEVVVEGLPYRRTEFGTEEVEIADNRVPAEPTPEPVAAVMVGLNTPGNAVKVKRRWCTRTGKQIAGPPE